MCLSGVSMCLSVCPSLYYIWKLLLHYMLVPKLQPHPPHSLFPGVMFCGGVIPPKAFGGDDRVVRGLLSSSCHKKDLIAWLYRIESIQCLGWQLE